MMLVPLIHISTLIFVNVTHIPFFPLVLGSLRLAPITIIACSVFWLWLKGKEHNCQILLTSDYDCVWFHEIIVTYSLWIFVNNYWCSQAVYYLEYPSVLISPVHHMTLYTIALELSPRNVLLIRKVMINNVQWNTQ